MAYCPCSGAYPINMNIGAGTIPATTATLSAIQPAQGTAQAPPVQIRMFESAFYSPEPQFAVMPYTPSIVSVISPAYNLGGGGAALAAETGSNTPSPPVSLAPPYSLSAGPCGNCGGGASFSQLPPTGAHAWGSYLQQFNRPYAGLFGPGGGTQQYNRRF
jgi:hypothetical protein